MIVMYSKPDCGHCVLAKAWLDRHNVEYTEIDVSSDPDALNFIREQGHRTVPQIYYDTGTSHKLLVEGGNTGLQAMDVDGLLSRVDEVSTFSLADLGDI